MEPKVINQKDESRQLPLEYKIALDELLIRAKSVFGDNLLSFIVGGSGGKGNIIDKWSDLDIYIVVKDMIVGQIGEFYEIKSFDHIHIGTTFYSEDDLNKGFIDFKTVVMLYEHTLGLNPELFSKITLPSIPYSAVFHNDILLFPQTLQLFKREYLEYKYKRDTSYGKPTTYVKKLTLLIKILLNKEQIFTYGYNQVFSTFVDVAEGQGFEFPESFAQDNNIIDLIENWGESKKQLLMWGDIVFDYINFRNGEK